MFLNKYLHNSVETNKQTFLFKVVKLVNYLKMFLEHCQVAKQA